MTTRHEILDLFDRNIDAAWKAIERVEEGGLGESWSLLDEGKPLIRLREAVIPGLVLNHLIHHRAHLCVYLRLNGIPGTGMYGSSGAE